MKKINTIIAIVMISCLVSTSCSKKDDQVIPCSDCPPPFRPSVFSSGWFPSAWQSNGAIYEHNLYIGELGADVIKDGKVLVFIKGGYEMRPPSALPGNFDANYISASAEIHKLKLTLLPRGSISSTLLFRYILIPAKELRNINYDDYTAVCNYYQLAP